MTHLAELEHLSQDLADALQSDVRDFFITVFRKRMGLVQQKEEMMTWPEYNSEFEGLTEFIPQL